MNKSKTKINNDWLIIAIFVLICAATWAATNTYHSYVNKKEVIAKKDLLKPLEANIDQSLFDTLEARAHLTQEELAEILSGSQLLQTSAEKEPQIPEEEVTPAPQEPQGPEEEIFTPTPQEEIPES